MNIKIGLLWIFLTLIANLQSFPISDLLRSGAVPKVEHRKGVGWYLDLSACGITSLTGFLRIPGIGDVKKLYLSQNDLRNVCCAEAAQSYLFVENKSESYFLLTYSTGKGKRYQR